MSRSTRGRRFQPFVRPFAGRRLPKELRVRHVGRLAEALPQGVEDPDFEILLRRIDDAPVYGGNTVEVYVRGADAFPAMRDAGRAAQRDLLVEFYIVKDDLAGQRLAEEVIAAAQRGVRVRVLADAVGSASTSAEYWRFLKDAGVEVQLFHPVVRRLWFYPFRDHRKILVADGKVAFTGGMNVAEEYGSPDPKPGSTWRDTHVRIEGPAAWEMAVVFSEGWTHTGGRAFPLGTLSAEVTESPGARILVLDSRIGRGQAETVSILAAIVGAARRRLWVTNAYFAPGHRAVRLLARAARRGVDVRLLLPGKSDVPLVRHAAHGYYEDLLCCGVRIFEYQAAILHAKTMVADDYLSVVGSSNLDFRSFVFNAECNLVILDRQIGATMSRIFVDDLEKSAEITAKDWQRRTFLHRLGDRAARWLSPVL
jgi:cardiolipin synthase